MKINKKAGEKIIKKINDLFILLNVRTNRGWIVFQLNDFYVYVLWYPAKSSIPVAVKQWVLHEDEFPSCHDTIILEFSARTRILSFDYMEWKSQWNRSIYKALLLVYRYALNQMISKEKKWKINWTINNHVWMDIRYAIRS